MYIICINNIDTPLVLGMVYKYWASDSGYYRLVRPDGSKDTSGYWQHRFKPAYINMPEPL
jgi:hypothetical protein